MRLRRWLSALAAAALVAGVGAAIPAAAKDGCKPRVMAKAIGNFQFSTRITARNRWKAAAREKYGFDFGTWARAASRIEKCDKDKPGKKWICVASARPCG